MFALRRAIPVCGSFCTPQLVLRWVARLLPYIRGWHRTEYKCLALPPNFNVQRYRWRGGLGRFSCWRGDISGSCVWGVFLVEECVEVSCQSSRTDCRECKFPPNIDRRGWGAIVREAWRFFWGVFPAARRHTRNRMPYVDNTFFTDFVLHVLNRNTYTQCPAWLLKVTVGLTHFPFPGSV